MTVEQKIIYDQIKLNVDAKQGDFYGKFHNGNYIITHWSHFVLDDGRTVRHIQHIENAF